MMKTTTHFLFTLLLTFLVGNTTAWGQIFIPSDAPSNGEWAENTHWYYIQCMDGNGWMSISNKDDKGLTLTTTTRSNTDEEKWCLVGDATNGYRFYNKASGTNKVLGLTNSSNDTYGDSRASMIEYTDGTTTSSIADNKVGFNFICTNSSYDATNCNAFKLSGISGDYQRYLNKRGNYLSYWNHNNVSQGTNKGSSFKFVGADDFEEALLGAHKVSSLDRSAMTNLYMYTEDYYDKVSAAFQTYKNKTAVSLGETKTTEAISELQPTIQYNLPQGGEKVMIGNLQHTSLYVFAKENDRDNESGGHLGSNSTRDSYRYLFTLIKGSNGKFKFYSDYYGKYVGAVPTKNDHEYQLTDEANAGEYTLALSSTLGYCNIYDADCTYKSGATTVNAWHMVNWNNNPAGNGVVRWESAATASCFKLITDISTYTDAWDAAIIQKASNPLNAIGYVNVTDDLTAALNAFKSASTNEKGIKYKALEEAIAATPTILPETDKYYTIKCVRGSANGNYLSENYGDTKKENSETNEDTGNNAFTHGTLATNIVPALWQFEQLTADGKTDRYYIKGSNSKNYLSNTNGTQTWMRIVPESGTRGEFIFNTSSSKVNVANAVALVDKSNSSADGYVSCRNEDLHVVAWDGGNDGSSNNFLIQEVTEIPVTISAAGYATLNLPMAVNIPEGVKAYTGTESEGEIKLTEITSGIIPAETPVILEGTGSETPYKFTIAYGNTDAALTTALKGTLTPTTIADDATAYILKNGGQGIGLYKVTSTTDREIKANKAYYGSTTGSEAAPVLLFNFGQTTGIHSSTNATSTAASETNVYFDLQGRRIPCPAHGIFVKASGEKVFIK